MCGMKIVDRRKTENITQIIGLEEAIDQQTKIKVLFLTLFEQSERFFVQRQISK